MNTEWIIVSEYCQKLQISSDFIELLSEEGLIDLETINHEPYLRISQLQRLEQYIRWYYDLSINIEGIDAIRHLLDRMKEMEHEIAELRNRLRLYDQW